jgi:hypothetical protein
MDCVAQNYEDAARAWAKHIDQPFSVTPYEVSLDLGLMQGLWFDIYPEVLEFIEADPHSFADKVAAYRHAESVKNLPEM